MIEIFANIFIFIGLFKVITAVIGCERLPDFFTKMHAATIGDAVGCPLILVGLALKAATFILGLKIFLLAIILLIINPTSSYILNRFAIGQNILPKTEGEQDD